MSEAPLLKTPLNSVHRALGARMVDFGGWDMPVQYSGIIDEHNAVRNSVGIFDVSHMGEIEIRGPEAAKLTDFVTTNNVAKLQPGQAHYSGLALRTWRFCGRHSGSQSRRRALFPVRQRLQSGQGFRSYPHAQPLPRAGRFRQRRLRADRDSGTECARDVAEIDARWTLSAIKYYWFTDGVVGGIPARIAHTGYTGEDGFEIYVAPGEAVNAWGKVMDAGAEFGIKPCGLGARNTLRLEAKMALYGHEIDASISPLEADLAWIVKLDKGEFVGRDTLLKQKESGLTRKLVGFEMRGRGIGRDGYEVYVDGAPAGWVTSGGPSPTLNRNIGLCYLPVDRAVPGTNIQVMVRQQPVDAVTVETPFYKRAK